MFWCSLFFAFKAKHNTKEKYWTGFFFHIRKHSVSAVFSVWSFFKMLIHLFPFIYYRFKFSWHLVTTTMSSVRVVLQSELEPTCLLSTFVTDGLSYNMLRVNMLLYYMCPRWYKTISTTEYVCTESEYSCFIDHR